jgi:PAS domain S-box-containing protein
MSDTLSPEDDPTESKADAVRLVEGISSHAIFMLDAEGRITAWPSPSASFYGYQQPEVLGEHVRVLLADDHGEEAIEDVATVLADARDGAVDHEGWHERADGSVFWGSLTLSPLQDGHPGFAAVCRDTTTSKKYQQMLERQNDRLKEFTDILAHDLRNPLGAIDQFLTLYEETGAETHLESVRETTDRMSRLVDDLLRVARQGDVVEEPEPTDIESVVETAWQGAGSQQASLTCETIPAVSADSDRLVELFENLFRNAVEHGTRIESETGEKQAVTVRVGPLADGIYVEDDGPGIPDSLGEEVFDHGVTTAQDGSGYGLSIVRTIVNAHGWDITLGSAAGSGARFEITGIEFLD